MSPSDNQSDDSVRYEISRHIINFILEKTTKEADREFGEELSKICDSLNHPLLIEFSMVIPIQLPPGTKAGFVKSFVNEAEKNLAKVGGGVTTISSEGGWFDESGIFVKDTSRTLSTHFNALDWRPMGNVIRDLVLDVQKQLKQRCVWILIDRVAYEEPINFLTPEQLRALPAESEFQGVDPEFDTSRNDEQVITQTNISGNNTNIERPKNSFIFNITGTTQPQELKTIESIVQNALSDGKQEQPTEIDSPHQAISEQPNSSGDLHQEDEVEQTTTKYIQFEDILRKEVDNFPRLINELYADMPFWYRRVLDLCGIIILLSGLIHFVLDLYGQNFYFGSEDYLFASVLNVIPFLCVFFINGGQRNEGFRILSHEFEKYEMGIKNKFQLVIYTTTMVLVIYAACSFMINYTFLIYSFLIVIVARKLNQRGKLNTINAAYLLVMLAISEFLTLLIWFFVSGVTEGFGSTQPEVHAILIYCAVMLLFALVAGKEFRDSWVDDIASFEMKSIMDFEQLQCLTTMLNKENWETEYINAKVDHGLDLSYSLLTIYGCANFAVGSQKKIKSIITNEEFSPAERMRNLHEYMGRELMKLGFTLCLFMPTSPLCVFIVRWMIGQPRITVRPDTKSTHEMFENLFSGINNKYGIDFYTHNLYDVHAIDFESFEWIYPRNETISSKGISDIELFIFDFMMKIGSQQDNHGQIEKAQIELDSIAEKINANRR